MTIEKLLGLSTDELEKLSREDLSKYFADLLPLTRPRNVEQPKNTIKLARASAGLSALEALAKRQGLLADDESLDL